jgi:hypothetical protein
MLLLILGTIFIKDSIYIHLSRTLNNFTCFAHVMVIQSDVTQHNCAARVNGVRKLDTAVCC